MLGPALAYFALQLAHEKIFKERIYGHHAKVIVVCSQKFVQQR
jgi:hypothetical protein